MTLTWVVAFVSASILVTQSVTGQQPSVMRNDVARMVRAAHALDRLMPWSKPVAEVDRVVRHGKAVVPLLIALLPDDPDDPALSYDQWDEEKILAGQQFDWNVQQHAAVALCRIYRISSSDCAMYSSRATREQNKSVKRFWLKNIAQEK
jgi:hypothetical protein